MGAEVEERRSGTDQVEEEPQRLRVLPPAEADVDGEDVGRVDWRAQAQRRPTVGRRHGDPVLRGCRHGAGGDSGARPQRDRARRRWLRPAARRLRRNARGCARGPRSRRACARSSSTVSASWRRSSTVSPLVSMRSESVSIRRFTCAKRRSSTSMSGRANDRTRRFGGFGASGGGDELTPDLSARWRTERPYRRGSGARHQAQLEQPRVECGRVVAGPAFRRRGERSLWLGVGEDLAVLRKHGSAGDDRGELEAPAREPTLPDVGCDDLDACAPSVARTVGRGGPARERDRHLAFCERARDCTSDLQRVGAVGIRDDQHPVDGFAVGAATNRCAWVAPSSVGRCQSPVCQVWRNRAWFVSRLRLRLDGGWRRRTLGVHDAAPTRRAEPRARGRVAEREVDVLVVGAPQIGSKPPIASNGTAARACTRPIRRRPSENSQRWSSGSPSTPSGTTRRRPRRSRPLPGAGRPDRRIRARLRRRGGRRSSARAGASPWARVLGVQEQSRGPRVPSAVGRSRVRSRCSSQARYPHASERRAAGTRGFRRWSRCRRR